MTTTLHAAASTMHATETIGYDTTPFEYIATDSRKIIHPSSTLFFALNGNNSNGHKYINELYDYGIRAFVIQEQLDNYYDDACYIRVPNSMQALQLLAQEHRALFSLPVVGITGSNGKTIVKEWLYQLMQADKNIVRSPKSYNSQLGVPLSVWGINATHQLALFEAGISTMGEMQKLQQILQPTQGIITNIGEAHSENFESIDVKAAQKLVLFNNCKELYYGKDYTAIHQQVSSAQSFANTKLYTWSKKTKANLQIGHITKTTDNTTIQGVYDNTFIHIIIPFTDDASIENAITCWLYLLCNGYDNEIIKHRMLELTPVEMRLELKDGINNCTLINDSYNSDLGSLAIALDFLNQQQQHPKKTLVLSDIQQSKQTPHELYTQVNALIKNKNVNRLIGVGTVITAHAHLFDVEKSFYTTTQDLLRSGVAQLFNNETLLLKGARSFEFETIAKQLQQKAHETVLEINLNAVQYNYNFYKKMLAPQVKIMAMVKAFSYGSGGFEIANLLHYQHVDYLAVAYADEGVELRNAGINIPIMVMNPDAIGFDAMLTHNLEPEIYSFRILDALIDAIKQRGIKEPIGIHLELETGMNRLGFDEEQLPNLIVKLKNNRQYIVVKSIFSHFVGSDEPSLDYYSKKQIALFDVLSTQLMQTLPNVPLRHFCNSSAIGKFPEAHFDMVRLGIGLYGISSNVYEQQQLQPVSSLKTIISQLKHVKQDQSIGYSRKGVVGRNSLIATIPIGYADGLPRKLSNGVGHVVIHGAKAPIVGNICMDMCMIDVTDIKGVQEGDEVIVFGKGQSVYEQAHAMNTIPYEVLTSVSRRVKRVYYHE
ncbi:MAG: bifunctional UDP-N-acetylmuramoyl-tripeptide:D-alanyl-D-alanine ligase/alanine racemase [Bacteroidia bacterium]